MTFWCVWGTSVGENRQTIEFLCSELSCTRPSSLTTFCALHVPTSMPRCSIYIRVISSSTLYSPMLETSPTLFSITCKRETTLSKRIQSRWIFRLNFTWTSLKKKRSWNSLWRIETPKTRTTSGSLCPSPYKRLLRLSPLSCWSSNIRYQQSRTPIRVKLTPLRVLWSPPPRHQSYQRRVHHKSSPISTRRRSKNLIKRMRTIWMTILINWRTKVID